MEQSNQRRKYFWTVKNILLISIVIIILIITNPTKQDYINWIKESLINSSNSFWEKAGVELFGNSVIDAVTKTNNFLICSIFKSKIPDTNEEIITLGVLKHFIPLNKPALKSDVSTNKQQALERDSNTAKNSNSNSTKNSNPEGNNGTKAVDNNYITEENNDINAPFGFLKPHTSYLPPDAIIPTDHEIRNAITHTFKTTDNTQFSNSWTQPFTVSDGNGGWLTAVVSIGEISDNQGRVSNRYLVFFWHNHDFIGWDSNYTSFHLYIKKVDIGKFTISYTVHSPNNSSEYSKMPTIDINYRWRNNKLIADGVPPKDENPIYVIYKP